MVRAVVCLIYFFFPDRRPGEVEAVLYVTSSEPDADFQGFFKGCFMSVVITRF